MPEVAMSRRRSGFTLIEMMTVLVIFGTITMLAMPRLQGVRARASLRSAQTQTRTYLMQARAVALQRGREARFVRNGNTISVTVDSSGTQVVYARPHDLQLEAGVALSATRDEIAFDPRGFAMGTSAMERVRLTRGTLVDSVCVTRLGKVIYRGCSL
jgi:prepilin-type N-terminal cleavage/methylation domain-containing protein